MPDSFKELRWCGSMLRNTPVDQPCLLEFLQMLGDVSFQSFRWCVELFAQRIDQILKGRASLARFKGVPSLGCYNVQAVTQALLNIQYHGTILSVSGARRVRHFPDGIWSRSHVDYISR